MLQTLSQRTDGGAPSKDQVGVKSTNSGRFHHPRPQQDTHVPEKLLNTRAHIERPINETTVTEAISRKRKIGFTDQVDKRCRCTYNEVLEVDELDSDEGVNHASGHGHTSAKSRKFCTNINELPTRDYRHHPVQKLQHLII